MSAALGGTAFAQAADDPGTQGGQDIVVTGSRGQARTVATSPTPIDVISGEQIAQLGGSMQLRDVLSQLVPSFQSQQVGSSSWNSVTRPAGLRGLSGVHVLVLVNGKRRHNSALIDLNSGSTSMGGNPVDLDQIPASAIARIEVLRDGAAAQYGTDAIAGVINVILKDNPNAGSGAIEAGQRYSDSVNGSDGETVSAQLSKGFHLGGNGSIVISAEGKLQKPTVRNSDYTGRIYPRINGADDPREATGDRRRYQGGLPDLKSVNLAQNSHVDVGSLTIYTNATFGYREARVGQAGRYPSTTSDIVQIYPDGFTPYYTMKETDWQATAGMKQKVGGWNLDFSTTYGRDYVRSGADNTLNASLGPSSPTRFDTFSAAFDQWTTNFDMSKGLEVLGGRHLQVSAGAEFRYESYVTKSLDTASWANGGYVYPAGSPLAGQPGAIGAQGATVITPADAANAKRMVGAAYIDLALDLTDRLLITGAGRFETYDDSSGNVWSGKVSGLWKATDWLNFRGFLEWLPVAVALAASLRADRHPGLARQRLVPADRVQDPANRLADCAGAGRAATQAGTVAQLQLRRDHDAAGALHADRRCLPDQYRRPHHPDRSSVQRRGAPDPEEQRVLGQPVRALFRQCHRHPHPRHRRGGKLHLLTGQFRAGASQRGLQL
jgi:iron complex outermembrane receptor protein